MDSLAIDPYEQARRQAALQAAQPQPSLAIQLPQQPMPDVSGISGKPNLAIQAPRGTVEGDQAERTRQITSGPGVDQIYSKIRDSSFGQDNPIAGKILGGVAQGLGKAGSLAIQMATPFGPLIPGTEEHHIAGLRQLNSQIGDEEGEREKEAQTRNLNSLPELHQAQLDLNNEKLNEKTQHDTDAIDQHLHATGFKRDETGNIVPLPYEEMSEQQQAVHDLKASQEEVANATADLKKAQKDNIPTQMDLARQRIEGAQQARSIALRRLGLSDKTYDARYLGTDENGNALPGAMITDTGQPVGSTFSANVRPTGTERNKADMAVSAGEQLNDIKAIVKKHPTLFGPGYGQTSAFKQWLGSQDPDAQRFIAARTIAGDHLAGTFGGRSEAALDALDKAIGQFKDNPKAMEAGLDQLLKANTVFKNKGTPKTEGSNAAAQAAPPKSGDVVDGYKFKGGDPSDQKNWEPVKKK